MSNRAPKQSGRRAETIAALACAAAGLVVFQFFGNAVHGYVRTTSAFWWWISQWIDPNAETQHGWLILAIAAWLLWRNVGAMPRRRDETSSVEEPENSFAGKRGGSTPRLLDSSMPALTATLAALVLHAVGFAAQQTRISIVALLLFTWGVVRLGGGRRWGGAAAFPLGFLVFAIPLNVLDSLGFWLRLWVIDASATIAHAVGIGVVQSGTLLTAPDGRYHYDVAAACSGVRSLMALAALSLLVGYLEFRSWKRRAAMLLLCVPLVYVGNVARIVAIVFAAQLGGPEWGDRAHTVMGYGVFVIVLGGVLVGARLIQRGWPEGGAGCPQPAASVESRERERRVGDNASYLIQPRERGVADRAPYLVAVLVLAFAIGEMAFLHRLASLPPRGRAGVVLAADDANPVELPSFLGTEWMGRRAEVSDVERATLPADTGYSRKVYVPLANPAHGVFVSIVLTGRDRTSIHRPELCLVGQGFTIASRFEHRFTAGQADDFPASVLRVSRVRATPRGHETVPELVAYWFVAADAIEASHWRMFLRDAWNRVFHARADRWAYVLVQTDATDGEPAALARMQTVLDASLPVFQRPRPLR